MKKFTLLITSLLIVFVSIAQNNLPTVSNAIPDQTTLLDVLYTYQVPDNTFSDLDNDPLIYSASKTPTGLIDNNTLPAWLSFDSNSRTLSGTPSIDDVGSITVRIMADDQNGGTVYDEFVLEAISNPPTDITLKYGTVEVNSVVENQPVNTTIGFLNTVDLDNGDSFDYALVSGSGDTDNASFSIINGKTLQTNEVFDFDVQSVYHIRIRTTDKYANIFEKEFVINVIDVNAPTDITLKIGTEEVNAVAENQPVNTTVGFLNTIDLDNGDSFDYALVSGSGDTDNTSFSINNGKILQTNEVFDFDVQSVYHIRIRTTDKYHYFFEKEFIINVIDVNAPTDITLKYGTAEVNSVAENQPVNTTIGFLNTVDLDGGDSFDYSLVSGSGDNDNASFSIINGKTLQTNEVFNFDVQSVYYIRIRTTDKYHYFFEKEFVINVIDVNAPTDIALKLGTVNVNSIAENQPVNTVVGYLSSVDVDPEDSFNYALVSGQGDTDNGSFNILNKALRSSEVFDFDVKSSYQIRIQSTDKYGFSFEKTFNINIANTNPPTDITLELGGVSTNSLEENQPVNTFIGVFQTEDLDANDSFSYTLVSGAGDTDNSSFILISSSGHLRTGEVFNFDIQSVYSIRVQTKDKHGNVFEKSFNLNVIDTHAPTDIVLENNGVGTNSIEENQPVNTFIGVFQTEDLDANDSFSYTLVSGAGDTDNSSFILISSSGHLRTGEVFNFDIQSVYSIRVQTKDKHGNVFEKSFNLNVIDTHAPTDIVLENNGVGTNSIEENQPVDSFIGVFETADLDPDENFIYSLVSGQGDTDNASFNVIGKTLRTSEIFDFDVKSAYSFRVQVEDRYGYIFEKAFTLNVIDTHAPTDIVLENNGVSTNSLEENQPVNSFIGVFETADLDPDENFIYSLVSGQGDTDNTSFNIIGKTLRTSEVFDFDVKSTYSFRVQVEDRYGYTFEKAFTLNVIDTHAPTDIVLENNGVGTNSIEENQPVNTFIGVFETTDLDPDENFIYSLVSGQGDTDNASFNVIGKTLRSSEIFDFDVKSTYSFRIQVEDRYGYTFEKSFSISVIQDNTAPVVVNSILDQSTSVGMAFSFTFPENTFEDSDLDALIYSASLSNNNTLPSWLSFNGSTRTFSGSPTTNEVGVIMIEVTADDGNGGSVSDNFNLEVIDINDAPTVANAISNQVATEDILFTFQFPENTFSDQDGDPLTYMSLLSDDNGLPTWLSFDGTTRTFSGTPTNNDVGTIAIKVIADDGNGGLANDIFDLVIANSNDAPVVFTAISKQVATEDTPFTFQFSENTFSDDDGDQLSYSALLSDDSDLPSWLVFEGDIRTFSGTPTNEFVGLIIIKVIADDGNGGTTNEEFELEVLNTNDVPISSVALTNQSAASGEVFSYQFDDNAFTDEDGDVLMYSATQTGLTVLPDWLSFDASTRTFSGTPSDSDSGTISIAVTADDGNDGIASANFDLTVSVITDIDDSNFNSSVIVYPNPADYSINIELSDRMEFYNVRILDIRGAEIRNYGMLRLSKVSVDVSDIQKGLYFIEINNSKERAFKRISVK